MNTKFADVPVRANGPDILASWFNLLRGAGINLENVLGGGFLTPTEFTVANNVSSFADVTGLSFDGTLYRSAKISFSIYRNTTGGGATELSETSEYLATYKTVSGSWEMSPIGEVGDAGLTFEITTAGQVRYKSSNITGTPATSKLVFWATTTGV